MEDWGHAPREREERHAGGRRRRDAAQDRDDLDNPKNGRRGEGNDEIGDELQFAYRQCATRCIERARHQALLPSDRLFGIFALYLANRNDKFVKRLVASPMRLDYVSPVGLLTSTQYTKEDALDLEKVLSDLERAAVASVGDGPALATSDTPESFWAKCHRLVSALERARDAEEEASRAATYSSPTAKAAKEEIEDMVLALLSKYDNLPKAAAELKALARCDVPGVDKSFYATAATMAEVLLAKRLLEAYEERYFVDEELPPPPSQRSTNADAGMSEAECAVLMDETGDALEGEQQLFMDEIVTYGREHLPTWLKPDQAIEMKKPERFAKVMAGFKWNKYNRAHFNSSTNPPPKTVTAYEFTLLYPNLAQNKLPYFEVLPTEKGWDDEYCIIVFRAGPPYLDVAYRIVNKQWDKGRGVKSTFDSNGKFKLYFRFTSTSYRR